jgi:hypothetical protein
MLSLVAPRARAGVLHIMYSVEQLLPDNPQMGRPGAAFLARANSTPFIIPIG